MTSDKGIEAQRVAEDHLMRMYEALDEDPDISFCGCITCVVREVLIAAAPHLLR